MDEEKVRQIIREELRSFLGSDRYMFQRHAQFFDGRNIQLGKTTGTILGTETTQKLGLYGTTPTAQQTAVSSPSLATVSGSGDDANINANFSAVKNAIDAMRTRLSTIGITA